MTAKSRRVRQDRDLSRRQGQSSRKSIEPSNTRFALVAVIGAISTVFAFRNWPFAVRPVPLDVLSATLQHMPLDFALFEFGSTMPVTLPSGSYLHVANGTLTWHIGNFSKDVRLYRIEALLHADNATEMLNALPKTFSMAADSVDALPSYEYYLQHHKATPLSSPVGERLSVISDAIIEGRVLPFVQEWYNCSECRVCTSLVRSYRTNERTRHPPHFDTQALITVVVHLTSHGLHFRGGLYVRTMPGTEQFLGAVAGDAIVHQHDVEHGVWVQEGIRYSWILWVQDSRECLGPTRSWHQKGVWFGDPIAQYHMSGLYASGSGGVRKNETKALALLTRAASQGYARAQHKLGNAFFSGIGVEEDMALALKWYIVAARQNSTFSAYAAGRMLQYGFGAKRDDAAAAEWYKIAAGDSFEHFPDAADRLASMLFKGAPGLAKNVSMAIYLWQQAASQGLASAASKLADCYERGDGMEVSASEAQKWRARAVEMHHPAS